MRILLKIKAEMGLPEKMFLDGDGMQINKHTEEFLKKHSVGLMLPAPHAPWENGMAERHGGLLKHQIKMFYGEEDEQSSRYGFAEVLEIAQARKNEAPGPADVQGKSAFEIWHGTAPVSHVTAEEAYIRDMPYGESYSDALQKEQRIREKLDKIALEGRAQKMLKDALNEKLKRTRLGGR